MRGATRNERKILRFLHFNRHILKSVSPEIDRLHPMLICLQADRIKEGGN